MVVASHVPQSGQTHVFVQKIVREDRDTNGRIAGEKFAQRGEFSQPKNAIAGSGPFGGAQPAGRTGATPRPLGHRGNLHTDEAIEHVGDELLAQRPAARLGD